MGNRYKSTKKARRKNSWMPILLIFLVVVLLGAAVYFVVPSKPKQSPASSPASSASSTASTAKRNPKDMKLANGMPSVTPRKTEFKAPELNLKNLEGKEDSLSAYLGKVVLVNNWATWCPPCTAELPELEAYYEKHKDDDFVIIGIEAGEPQSQVSSFIKSSNITYPIWVDPGNQSLRVFNMMGLPNSIVFDREGTARLIWTGAISLGMLEEYVTPIIEQ